MKGYIKLHRQLQDCWLWKDEPFSRGQAWVDLLMLANHSEHKMQFNGNLITVGRGQIITSIMKLSERWKWSRNKTKHFIDVLESDGMVTTKGTTKGTTITIVNWDNFQLEGSTRGTTEGQQKDNRKTSERHQKDTYNNDKNDKKCFKNERENAHHLEELERRYLE